jgi:hypothetical protein
MRKMKEEFNLGKFYTFIEENNGDGLFGLPVKKTCNLEFKNDKFNFSVNLNEDEMRQLVIACIKDIHEDEMKQLVGECVKVFGLKAVISAASETDVDDDE